LSDHNPAAEKHCSIGHKHIHEQLHDDLDSFSDFSQDSNTDIFECIDPDSEISRPDLSNSDDSQVSANVGGDDGGRGGYDDEDDDEKWALWYENNHDFYMIPFSASSGCKAP
jgi:hypothetical protein